MNLVEVKTVRLGSVMLAAGGSTRMGTQKLLLPWGNATVVGRSLTAAMGARLAQVVVVTGRDSEEVEQACRSVCVDQPVEFVRNPDWASGIASSIRRGMAALHADLDGFFVALGDMPLVDANVYRELAIVFRDARNDYILPTFQGESGHPRLFPIKVASELQRPEGDTGLKALLQRHPERVRHVPVANAAVCLDLDTPEQYAEACRVRRSGAL